jgi:hypothetical protein
MSLLGTTRTCRQGRAMSDIRGTPDVAGKALQVAF